MNGPDTGGWGLVLAIYLIGFAVIALLMYGAVTHG